MDTIRIRLFGGFSVQVGEREVPERAWRLRKAKSLVKLLALAPERRVHRERVTEQLWPERAPGAAANNFHQALYVARRALEAAGGEPAAVLPLRDDVLALAPDGRVEIDVDAFEAAAARARDTGEPGDYRTALELHGGELLPEDRFEPWALGRRDAVTEGHLALLLELAERLGEGGETAAAVEVLEQAVVVDPLHEAAHRALMRTFAAAGRRQQALAQYHQLRGALRSELEAEPDPQTTSLYRTLLRGDAGSEPAAPAPGGSPTNLPIPLTSFVGRDRERGEVDRLLDRTRLLTLTGAGGAGKTRLALEVAGGRAARHPDGVWLVELAGLRHPGLVPGAVAAALGRTLPAQQPTAAGLASLLLDWDGLLVVDNCEHLVSACASLSAELLGGCPGVRILATSREPLRVPGEVAWRVPSLALPVPGGDPEGLLAAESIRLFCGRARDAAPGFALTTENAAAVAEICLRLDGMPLALELAAARAGALSPAQIAERLGDSLAVLTAGSRAGLDRHGTLRATITWSHDLLTDAERALFRRLSVFAGSFALEAAEAITAGEPVERNEVADLLGRLVDKSLVTTEEEPEGYRYRLLEPVRQYAREPLAAAGEADATAARHLSFFLGRAEEAPDRLEPDRDNLRTALAWALDHDPGRALMLAVRMWPMWMAGSHFLEGRRWVAAALAAAPEPTSLRAEALRAAAGLEVRLGHPENLRALAEERVAIHTGRGDRVALAHALDEAGVYEYMVGRWDAAGRFYDESLALAETLGDRQVAAAALYSRALLAHTRGDFTPAREAMLECLARLHRVPADETGAFFRIHTAGLFVAPEGPEGQPRVCFEETVQFFRRVDARRAIGYVLAGLGDLSRAQGLAGPAVERLTESLEHFRDARDPMGTAFALGRLGTFAGVRGEHDLGREWLEEGLALRRELGDRRGECMMLGNLGMLAARAGDPERGRALIAEAQAHFEATDDAPGQMGMRLNLGNVALEAGERDCARALLEAARESAADQRLVYCAAWAGLTLAELALAEGGADRAAVLVGRNRPLLEELGDRWGLARADELAEAAAKPSLSRVRDG